MGGLVKKLRDCKALWVVGASFHGQQGVTGGLEKTR